jgi:formate dehydrogenase subunit delta
MSHDVATEGREKLVRMANQIADFFDSAEPEHAAASIAKHINDFWEPRMRRHFFEIVEDGGAGLRPSVIAAVPLVRRPG